MSTNEYGEAMAYIIIGCISFLVLLAAILILVNLRVSNNFYFETFQIPGYLKCFEIEIITYSKVDEN